MKRGMEHRYGRMMIIRALSRLARAEFESLRAVGLF